MPQTVLLVEDDPVILELLQVSFSLEGFTVVTATDGQEGIDAARTHSPDIIVMDIMMPNVTGIEAVRVLKADADTSAIPIVLLSAKAQASDVQDGMDAGADLYMTKPFEPFDLLDKISHLLEDPPGTT